MTRGVPWIAFCVLASFLEIPRSLAQTGFLSVEPDCCTEVGVFLPCSATSAAEVASMRLRVQLPPVPAYPDNGEIPEELRLRLLFLDEESGDLVVSFPPYPDFEGLLPGQKMEGGRVKDKTHLGIATCPSLSVAIYPSGDPRSRRHVYHYRLHNRRQARLPIRQMILPVPLTQETLPVYELVSPYGWHVRQWNGPKKGKSHRLRGITFSWGDDYRQKMRRFMIRRRVNWHAVGARIAPGNTLDTFMLSTEALPGIVRAYVQGPGSVLTTRMNWTGAVNEQLQPFGYMENNSLSISTVGPKFSPDADKRLIALDFIGSLEELIRTGELDGESPFIRKVLPLLETVAGGAGGGVEASAWPSETDFEFEILMALRLSLGG